MANPLLNSSFFGGPTNGAPAQNGSTNLFSGLLEQARTLGNGAENQQNGYGFLPDVRPTLPDIERQSESVIGRGKGRVVRSGEGHSLLNRHGINTLNTQDRISQLAGSQAGPSGLADSGSVAPPRRRRRVHDAIGAQNIDVAQTYQGDIPSWSRNWHETVILQGIETQRKNTVKAFNKQFQTRMANNWEEEKKKVLQNELGVAQDEAGNGAGLGRSSLGQSQRRFPLAQSTTKSSESAQGGLVMHSREHKYANTIEKINKDRLNHRDPQVCSILLEAAQGSQQSEIASALSLISSMVHESGSTADRPPVHERQYAHDYLADARSIEKRRLNEKLAEGVRSRLEEDYRDHMNKQNAANARIAAIGGQPGVLEKVRGYSAIQLHQRDAEARYHTEKIDGAPLYMHVWYLLRSGYSAEAVDLLAHNQNRLKREDAALPGALKAYYAAPDRRLGRGQRDQLMNDYNNHIRNNHSVDVFKAALYKLIGRFDLGKKGFKGAVDTTEDWIWGNLMLIRESGNSEDGTAEKYDYADFGRIVQDTGSAHFDGGGAKWYVWLTALLCAGEFESAIAYLHSKPEYRTDAVHLAVVLAYYGLLRIADSPEDPLCFTRDVGFSRSSSLNFYRMISIYITPFFTSAPEAALQYAYLIALNGDVPLQGEQQKQLALNMVRDIVVSSRQFGKLLGTVRPDGVKVPGAIERDINLLGLRDSQAHIRSVILSAAEQSNIDASLTDSIELYHLAGAPEKVIDAVTRALAQSISVHGASRTGQLQQRLDLRGAFGGVESIEDLAARVIGVYENGIAARQAIGPKKWEALGTLVRLKRAMAQYDGDRPDLALDTFKQSEVIPLDTIDPSTIARYTARFIALLDNSAVADLDEVVITTMKCIHKLSSQLQNSPYGDAGRQQQLQRLKESAMAVMQFASGLRLRLGADVYRQLSSISAFL